MYGLSQSQIEELQSGLLKTRIEYERGTTTMMIESSDIVQGGLAVDRYCTSGEKIELGSAIAAELTLKLLNYDARFDGVSFDGAELTVEVGKDDLWIPCGVYHVDDPPRMLNQINIQALDRMTYFDYLADSSLITTFPMPLQTLVQRVCNICEVPFVQDLSEMPNADLSVLGIQMGSSITWRSVIQHAALLMGTCAYMDREGKLAFSWYNEEAYRVGPENRYMDAGNDLQENNVIITSLEYTDSSETYTFGNGDGIQCGGTAIVFNANVDTVLQPVYEQVSGMVYRPYNAGIVQAWFLDPMDGVVWVDKNGIQTASYITHINCVLNGHTRISAVGSEASNSVYNRTGMTSEIANALDKVSDIQIGGVNLVDLSKAYMVGTIEVNGGVLAEQGKDIEVKIGG